ncbi:hypothetical protein MSAN_00123900 [Mycena sanguinolenta]|uniref:Uncharacterized protein n=1 Tax=Mycena sanguinolenta TaxID=230812 RepID=A0A8H6ZDI8_9AGAR|nr:hypothetical protein MSAN_00123900 [Mycena sanguinolenta]
MPRFSMMISYRFRKFWIVIKVPILRQYIFMRTAYVTFPPPVLGLTYRKNQDFTEAFNYLYSAFQRAFFSPDCTNWIRRSTGRLCTELTPSSVDLFIRPSQSELPALSRIYPVGACAETIRTFIDSLTLEQYHNICGWNLGQNRHFDLSASTTANIGAVFHCSIDPLEDSVEIAFFPSLVAPYLDNWTISGGIGEVMPNGWTGFQSGEVLNNTLSISLYILWDADDHTWLSQANHIFCCLNIVSNFEDYVFVDGICFHLHVSRTTGDPPEGFLFLCPREHFQTGPSSVRFPACTAYWSLDPSGTDRLSLEEATRLGFPSFELTIEADGYSWDASVYEGLRQFHQAKGFDPYSQDVTRHLGHPFYQLSSERDALPWAYVDSDGEDFDADIKSNCNSTWTEDYESESPPISACDDHRSTPNPPPHL